MIASLYQSGSAALPGRFIESRSASQSENMRRFGAGRQFDVIARAMPGISFAIQEIDRLILRTCTDGQRRQIDEPDLLGERIEIHNRYDDVRSVSIGLAVTDQLRIVG